MREILFRGKRYDDGSWVEGYLIHDEICNTHIPYIGYLFDGGHDIDVAEIILGTVGQFTGLTDKNGKKIFEGDIVTACDEITFSPFEFGITGKVVYDECAFFIEPKDVMETQYLFNECAVYEVVGNIHDNPELLEVEENG